MRNPQSLRVYKLAIELNDDLARYRPRHETPLQKAQKTAGQIEDAINEGCYRGTEKDFLRYIIYARASAAETAGQLRQAKSHRQLPIAKADDYHDRAQCILAMLIKLHRFNADRLHGSG